MTARTGPTGKREQILSMGKIENYIKSVYQSLPNLFFVGVMILFSLVIHPAFLFLLLAGELSVLVLAQTTFVQRALRAGAERQRRREQDRIENQILGGLPETYKTDFRALQQLCGEIEKRAIELEPDQASRPLMDGVIEKLSSFRLEYIRMLRGHFLLGNRNYAEIEKRLEAELKRLERSSAEERSEQVRTTLDQNTQILRQRVTKARQLSELVRLIQARLRVVSDSLQLIQDEVYSMTDVRGVSGVVDELLVKLEMNDEFRSYYDDMLTEGNPALATLDSEIEPGAGPAKRPVTSSTRD
jgi:hypothetical protein